MFDFVWKLLLQLNLPGKVPRYTFYFRGVFYIVFQVLGRYFYEKLLCEVGEFDLFLKIIFET